MLSHNSSKFDYNFSPSCFNIYNTLKSTYKFEFGPENFAKLPQKEFVCQALKLRGRERERESDGTSNLANKA